jgi:hypothetical protein
LTYCGRGINAVDQTFAFTEGLHTVAIEGMASNIQGAPLAVLPIMRSTLFGRSNNKSTVGIDSKAAFSSTLPDAGLIDLSKYGVRPVHNQPLDELKDEIKDFVLFGSEKSSKSYACVSSSNVFLYRESSDSFRYLFYVASPIEKGQTVELRFQSVSEVLHSEKYSNLAFPRRRLIEEAFWLLSINDLKTLNSYLQSDLVSETDYHKWLDACDKPGAENAFELRENLKRACEARRRLHWVALRMSKGLGSTISRLSKPYFGYFTFESDEKVTTLVNASTLKAEMSEALKNEVRKELLACLELDADCGSKARSVWCDLAHKTFNGLCNELVVYYCQSDRNAAAGLTEKLESAVAKMFSFPVGLDHVADCAILCRGKEDGDLAQALQEVRALYKDTVSFDDQELLAKSEDETLELIACTPPDVDTKTPHGRRQVLMKPINQINETNTRIDASWYRQLQWDVVCAVVQGGCSFFSLTEEHSFVDDSTISKLKDVAMQATSIEYFKEPNLSLDMTMWLPKVLDDTNAPDPHAFQFFLGLVWPALKRIGWHLIAGESPNHVTFVSATGDPLVNKSHPWKHQRDKKRAYLARESKETGLGDLPKLTKRLIISMGLLDRNKSDHRASSGVKVTAEATLQKFLSAVLKELDKDDDQGAVVAKRVVAAFTTCCKEVAPFFKIKKRTEDGNNILRSADNANDDIAAADNMDCDAQTSDVVATVPGVPGKHKEVTGDTSIEADISTEDADGCDYLLQLLLVLPSILRQSELPIEAINDSLVVVRNLVDYITSNYQSLVDETLQPSAELYTKDQKAAPVGLASRIRFVHNSEAIDETDDVVDSEGGVMTELLRPEDKPILTDFLVLVLDQAIPCRATEKDCKKKYRRIHVGFPGFVCRHCMSSQGEGRYFFTTIESLTTASTVFEKHVLKCPFVPVQIKSDVIMSKIGHTEQRKHLPTGAQQAFFNRLWDRLRSAKIEGVVSGVYAADSYAGQVEPVSTTGDAAISNDALEFTDHVSVLDHVRATYANDKDIQDALNQYYNCLEYGGRIFYTSLMPERFSAEWLLGKVAKRKEENKVSTGVVSKQASSFKYNL